nr:PREDICTED: protein HESO1-like isoform X2 [Daucus carota subsp. sativus]XP_017215864.1 PREDICTED: protein HESO1-like isoform X2 [Daucus carota subsp. sativus]XP_017215865.1 PREDICTED: protein HESO1-like isoform X2 [Daucus carota subsp. sativus]XP_017215866.1 PREDICTED: protein HESO1-like isoform X2 [Daucus carota subsp. sativus]
MSSHSQMEQALQNILSKIKPEREDWAVRFDIINDVRDAVQTVESLRGATVEPFGSFVSELFSKWGDLDISVEIHTYSHISHTARKQKESLLADLLGALRSKGTWRKLRLISNARVPFLKLEHHLQRITCDISVTNLLGQMKAKLLFWITGIDERFRDIVLLVKEWAIALDINEAESGTLNSYCLTLMVLFHFQTCVPAILPPLKEIYPGDLAHDFSGVRADAERKIEETCAVNINRFKLDRSRRINRSSLFGLLISFFAKFSDIDGRASAQGINPYSGCWEDIGNNMAWLSRTFVLYVEDPFEQPVNTARAITNNHLTRMADAFRATHNMLASKDRNQATLYATLIRRDRLPPEQSLVRNKPGNNRSRPQINRASSSSSQSQTRNNGRSNNENMNRPVQPRHHNQARQSQTRNNGRSNNENMNRPVQPRHHNQARQSQTRNNGRSNNENMSRPVQPRHHNQAQQIWRPKSS